MRVSLERVRLQLPREGTMPVEDARGVTVRVCRGRLWITEQGLRDDVFLDAGESWRLRRRGRAVLQAEAPTEFELVAGTDRSPAQPPIAEADLACARSTCFWIFPVDVFGTGPKRTSRGTL